MVETQLRFREILGDSLTALEKGANPQLFFTIMGFAFLYGFLHAAGPGHRKTVIFSLFLSRKAKWYEPFIASFVAAGVHGGTAVLLIILFQVLFSRIQSSVVSDVSALMEGISYALLALLALWFLLNREIISIIMENIKGDQYLCSSCFIEPLSLPWCYNDYDFFCSSGNYKYRNSGCHNSIYRHGSNYINCRLFGLLG